MNEARRFQWRGTLKDLSSAELLRKCGQKLTDPVLWQEFQDRFHTHISTYVLRAVRIRFEHADPDLVCDLAQDVYLRLLQHDGRTLRTFRGDTDFSVLALLGRTTMNVVSDYFRSQNAEKRQPGEVISIERSREEHLDKAAEDMDFTAILSWIDVERLMESDTDRRNAARNVLIFKLHYIHGFTPGEISEFPTFALSASAIETVLTNLRTRLKRRMGQ